MFIDIVTTSTADLGVVDERAGLFADPPDGLAAAIAWESGDDEITTVMVRDTPGDRGDFAFKKMMPLMEEGAVRGKPAIVTPHRVFLRGTNVSE
jgi:hypothetical protein